MLFNERIGVIPLCGCGGWWMLYNVREFLLERGLQWVNWYDAIPVLLQGEWPEMIPKNGPVPSNCGRTACWGCRRFAPLTTTTSIGGPNRVKLSTVCPTIYFWKTTITPLLPMMELSWFCSGRYVRLSDVYFQSVQVKKNDDDILAEYIYLPSTFVRYLFTWFWGRTLNETCLSRVRLREIFWKINNFHFCR